MSCADKLTQMQRVCQIPQEQANALASAYLAGKPSAVITSFEHDVFPTVENQAGCREAVTAVQSCALDSLRGTLRNQAETHTGKFTRSDTENLNDGTLPHQEGMTGVGVFSGARVDPLGYAPMGGSR